MGAVGEFWDTHLLPRVIDVTCSDRATGRWRRQALGPVAGTVLEVGFASGTNLLHYGKGVDNVQVVEPSDTAWNRSAARRARFPRPVERIGLDGARIELADASVDAVVSTYTMCTIPGLDAALAEFRRVLKPGGALHFVEHSLSPDREVAARQQRWQPRWEKVSGGCHLDRDIPELIGDSGFEFEELTSFYAPGPSFMRPFVWLVVGRGVVG